MTSFLQALEARLAAPAPRPVNLPVLPGLPALESLRESAVLLPLRLRDGEPHLVFTVRPLTLRSHGGQISFPGGKRELDDPSAEAAALRESEEELGIPRSQVRLLGGLDEIFTPTLFRIAPFVGVIPSDLPLTPNPDEVAAVFEAPVRALAAPGVHRVETMERMGRRWDVDYYPFGDHLIWGATGRILRNFLARANDLL